jgi:hypothetical protein
MLTRSFQVLATTFVGSLIAGAARAQEPPVTEPPAEPTDAPTAQPMVLTLSGGLVLTEADPGGAWGHGGAGMSNHLDMAVGIPKATVRFGGKSTPWLMVAPYFTFSSFRTASNLEAGTDTSYDAYDGEGVYTVDDPQEVRLRYGGIAFGGALKFAHPYGFLDVGAGVALHGLGHLVYFDETTTSGDECALDRDEVANATSDRLLYTDLRYAVVLGGKFDGAFLGVDAKIMAKPTLVANTTYNLGSGGIAVPLPDGGGQALTLSVVLGVGL